MWTGWKCKRERQCRLGWWQSNKDASLFKELVAEGCPGTSGREKEPSHVEIGRAGLHGTTKTSTT